MSREIKFQAWYKSGKKMFEVAGLFGDLVHVVSKGEISGSNAILPLYRDLVELREYTGLKDKRGKEIYEGDIVRWYGNATSYFPVVFSVEDGAWIFQIEPFSEFDEPKMLADFAPYSEVVGNIYENPELLEQST